MPFELGMPILERWIPKKEVGPASPGSQPQGQVVPARRDDDEGHNLWISGRIVGAAISAVLTVWRRVMMTCGVEGHVYGVGAHGVEGPTAECWLAMS